MLFFWGHHPIAINIINDRFWNFHNCILFFTVELRKGFLRVKDGLCRRFFGFTIFGLFIFLVFTHGLASSAPALTISIAIVLFYGISVVSFPLGLCVEQVVFSSLLPVLFSFNFVLAILFGSSSGNLAPGDVGLAASECRGQPFEKLAKASVVLLDILSEDAFDDFLAVGDSLVGQDLPTLGLSIHLVGRHSFWDLVMFDLSDPLPAKFVGVGQAYSFACGTREEHQTLDDLRVALHAILKQILDHIAPLRGRQELLRNHLQCLVLGLNIEELLIPAVSNGWLGLTFFVDLLELLVEVFGVTSVLLELVVLDLLGDLLGEDNVILSRIFSIRFQCFQSSVSVGSKSHTLLFLPDFDESLNGAQGEDLLLFGKLAVLAHSVQTANILLGFRAERI